MTASARRPLMSPSLKPNSRSTASVCWPTCGGGLSTPGEPSFRWKEAFTIAIGLRLFRNQMSEKMPETMAMSVVALIPVLIVFFIAQRYFIQGIVISGIKG